MGVDWGKITRTNKQDRKTKQKIFVQDNISLPPITFLSTRKGVETP